jgi:hypothetical protein
VFHIVGAARKEIATWTGILASKKMRLYRGIFIAKTISEMGY